MNPMTHGDRWLSAVHKRLEGYCRTRGWLCGAPVLTSERRKQYVCYVSDRLCLTVGVFFEMDADKAFFVDEYGSCSDDPVSAKGLEEFLYPFALASKPIISKRQLSLEL